jgi:flagellar biogenesis protein FliO
LGLELVKVFVALLITLAAVYLLLRFLKQKMLPQKGMIEMLHYQSFGPKRGIAVVKILNDYIAVGIADQSISLLSKLNPADMAEALKSQKAEVAIQNTKHRWLRTKKEGDGQ